MQLNKQIYKPFEIQFLYITTLYNLKKIYMLNKIKSLDWVKKNWNIVSSSFGGPLKCCFYHLHVLKPWVSGPSFNRPPVPNGYVLRLVIGPWVPRRREELKEIGLHQMKVKSGTFRDMMFNDRHMIWYHMSDVICLRHMIFRYSKRCSTFDQYIFNWTWNKYTELLGNLNSH